MRRKTISVALACLLAISFVSVPHFTGGSAYASTASPHDDVITLAIPNNVAATALGTVTVPVHFWRNGAAASSTVFSLDYDPACLTLDAPAGYLAPGVAVFGMGPQFSGSASVDTGDTDGELDIVIGDFSLPLSTLSDRDNLVRVTFNVVCVPAEGDTIVTPITFSAHPPPSFGNTQGHPITGEWLDGSVRIEGALPGQTGTPTPVPGNSTPVATDDFAFTRMEKTAAIDVLANDTDLDGDSLTITDASQGGLGQVTINAGRSISYTPASGRTGEDVFTYAVDDGRGGLAAATVHVTVGDANRPPVAVNDSEFTPESISVLIDVLANDYDVDPLSEDAQLALTVLGQPGHGRTLLNQDGIVTYIPDHAYVGEDTFLYAIVDEEGASAIGTVMVTVEPSDEPHGSATVEVDLADFTVGTDSSGNVARWTTRAEGDLSGFQVHRTEGAQVHEGIMDLPYAGTWTWVSPLIGGQGSDGGVYTFVDDTAVPGVAYAYMLAALGHDNHLTLYGPQMVVTAPSDLPYIVRLLFIANAVETTAPSDLLP